MAGGKHEIITQPVYMVRLALGAGIIFKAVRRAQAASQ